MSEETQGDTTVEGQQPPAPPAGDETNQGTSDASVEASTEATGDNSGDESEGKSEDHQIPKHRFDEEVAKRRDTEAKLQAMSTRFDNMADALSGKSDADKDHVVEGLSKKHGVSEDFIKDMLGAAEEKAKAKYQKDTGTMKQALAKQDFQITELNQLYKAIPESRDMSDEDRTELEKMAFTPQYAKTPVADIYKILTYGRPQGKGRTAETGSSGAGRMTGGDEVDISKMTLEEFEAFSEGQAKKG